jgi:hypothetical protein
MPKLIGLWLAAGLNRAVSAHLDAADVLDLRLLDVLTLHLCLD